MRKWGVLILACVAGRLWADPVTFNITSLSGSAYDFDPIVSASGSGYSNEGDSITISLEGGMINENNPGFPPGGPIRSSFGMDCEGQPDSAVNCRETALATIGGQTYSLQLLPSAPNGGIFIDAPTNLTFQPPVLTYTTPGTATGSYTAICDGSQPVCPEGTVMADVLIDLPGTVTTVYEPAPQGNYYLDTDSFVSIPEPSSAALSFAAAGSIAAGIFLRTRARAARRSP